jgi:histidinol-phosphate aminotransferase
MRAYQPPLFAAPVDLDLSRNEGRATVTRVERSADELAAITSRYPDTTPLRAAISERHGVPAEQVLMTAGGDDALFRCLLANGGKTVVSTTPTFEMIRSYAAQLRTPLVEIPWWRGPFPVGDFLAEAAAGPRMAIVVAPNNPTGAVIDQAELERLAAAFSLVVLDAAYADFAALDITPAALGLDGVVVIRTLSKAFGIAGLRVGYLLGSEELVAALSGYGSPYSISALSSVLAEEVLSGGEERIRPFLREVAAERETLTALLDELGCEPLPSQGNFVLATRVDPSWLVPAAATLGVGLRQFAGRPELAGCVRITVPGDRAGYRRLEEALRIILAPEALLFDMDGVLVDVQDSYRAAIAATAATFGVIVTPGDISAAKARGNASDDWDLTRRLCAAAGVDAPFDIVRDRFELIYQGEGGDGLKRHERLMVDATRLEAWAERLPLAVVTARPRKDAQEALDRFGIGHVFSEVVAREDAALKPDPAPIRLALERLGVSRAWMLGDTIDDLLAARGAGVLPITVTTGDDEEGVLSGAARVLASVSDLEEVLDATTR